MVTEAFSLLCGDLILGLFAASYGGYMTAVLDTWRPIRESDFRTLPRAALIPGEDIDFNPWTVDPLPRLGGSAFYYPGDADLTGARVKPATNDPHVFYQETREKKEAAAKGVVVQPPSPDRKRREDRGRPCARYQAFRNKSFQGDHNRRTRSTTKKPRGG